MRCPCWFPVVSCAHSVFCLFFRLPRVPRAALGDNFNIIRKALFVTKLISIASGIILFFVPFVEGVSAVLTVPGSDTIYAADVILTITSSLWSLDYLMTSLSFGIVGGRVIWVLGKYLYEENSRKASNSVKDVQEALTQVFLLSLLFFFFLSFLP